MNMKTILLMILSATLLSCNDLPQDYFIGEQCSPELVFVTDSLGDEWVDISRSVCRCRAYEISRRLVGPVDRKVIRRPLKACNLMKGYSPKEDTRLVNFLEWVRMNLEPTSLNSLDLPRQSYSK